MDEFRDVMRAAAADPRGAAGIRLWEVLRKEAARQVASAAGTACGYVMQADEAATMLWLRVLETPAVVDAILEADNPLGWIYSAATRPAAPGTPPGWMRTEVGTIAMSFDELVPDGPWAACPEPDEPDVTLEDAIRHVCQILLPRTPEPIRSEIRRLVGWCALNPPQQRGHWIEPLQAAEVAFPTLTSDQVHVIAQLCWGARKYEQGTCLLALALRDPEFRPAQSSMMTRFLRRVQGVLAAGCGPAVEATAA